MNRKTQKLDIKDSSGYHRYSYKKSIKGRGINVLNDMLMNENKNIFFQNLCMSPQDFEY